VEGLLGEEASFEMVHSSCLLGVGTCRYCVDRLSLNEGLQSSGLCDMMYSDVGRCIQLFVLEYAFSSESCIFSNIHAITKRGRCSGAPKWCFLLKGQKGSKSLDPRNTVAKVAT